MTRATGIGSMPGDDARAYAEAVRVVLGELPQLPCLPELPGRGAIASMTGRTLGLVADLGADLQPAGWRLTDASGVDQRRARSLLAQDLDTMEEQAQGLTASLKVQVSGPWTLAATVEKPRGDKVLSDHGARRELSQSLAEGLRGHVRDLHRRFPEVSRLIVQVDEPALPAVLAGQVPTASGFGRHRVVDLAEASTALQWVFEAVSESGAEPWVHSCAPQTPLRLLLDAGAQGAAVDLATLDPGGHDVLAEALEAGTVVALGVVEPLAGAGGTGEHVVERVLRWLDLVGLDPGEVASRLVITPRCGLAGATGEGARAALARCAEAARQLDQG